MKYHLFTLGKTTEPLHSLQSRVLQKMQENRERRGFFQRWHGTAEQYREYQAYYGSKDVKRWELEGIEKVMDILKSKPTPSKDDVG